MRFDVPSSNVPLRVRTGEKISRNPEITVVVMSTNSDSNAIDAVKSVMGSAVRVEIVVVNTGSGSLEIVLSDVLESIILIETDVRQFPGGTRNIGIGKTCAPVVSFLAADCIASKEWCEQRVIAHRSRPVTASALLPAPRSGRVSCVAWASYQLTHPERIPRMRSRIALPYGLSYDRSIFEEFGLFDESMRVGEDSLFNDKIHDKIGSCIDNSVVTLHRYPGSFFEGVKDQYKRGVREFFYYKMTRNRSRGVLVSRNIKRFFIVSCYVVNNRGKHPYVSLFVTLPLAAVLLVARVVGNVVPAKRF